MPGVIVENVSFAGAVEGWFTGRDRSSSRPPIGERGNLSHRRPHRPGELALDRARVGHATRTDPSTWHCMRQRHGAEVGVVGPDVPHGTELRGVDAMITDEADRPLVVQVADCVPVLLATTRAIGVVHAGRRGVAAGVVAAALQALGQRGTDVGEVQAVLGPAIGGCCYEVPQVLRASVLAEVPEADAVTTWGTASLDLPAAVEAQLVTAGVSNIRRAGGCTRCDAQRRWFSHRADPATGRQVGLIVRRGEAAA